MKFEYKIDICEKLCIFYTLFYFVFGLFTTYSWLCTKLDEVSASSEKLRFWESIAATNGILNLINFAAIIFCLSRNRRYKDAVSLINDESNRFFHIICTPLFFITILYLSWRSIAYYITINDTGSMIIFMTVCELLLYSVSMPFMVNLSKLKQDVGSSVHNQINLSVLILTFIGILSYFIYHITAQQVTSFLKSASNNSNFKSIYNYSNYNSAEVRIENYGTLIVIIFCCCGISFMISLIKSNCHQLQETPSRISVVEESPHPVTDKIVSEKSLNSNRWHLNIPPFSLLLGIIFITISIILLVIVIALTNDSSTEIMKEIGEKIISIFPTTNYLLSMPILCLQIYAMEYWPKLKHNNNLIDKSILMIGTSGILIASVAELKTHTFIQSDNNMNGIIISYFFMIFSSVLQTVTIALALDREYQPSAIQSWHSRICPPFAMFCANLALLLVALYYGRDNDSIATFAMKHENRLFVKIFNEGFHTIAVTLVIIYRLHSTLVFWKMTLSI